MTRPDNIPNHWQIKKLGEVFTIERGGSPRPIEDYITNDSSGINWIKIGDTKDVVKYIYKTKEKIRIEGVKRSRMVYEDDFILSNSMSFGRPYIMKTSGCIHDGWLVIRKTQEIDNNFLYHLLSSSMVYKQFCNLAKGSTVKNLNIEAVKQVEVKFPPLPEQQAIVAKIEELFSELDKGIESLKTAQQQLTVYRQSLLKAAFEGKLTAQWRSEQHTTDFSLAAEPKTKYLAQGDLPEGWKKEKLGVVCEIKNGKNQKIVENPNGKYPIYGSAGKMGYANSYLCEAGSTIVGRKGTINKPLYVNEKFWNVDTAFGFIPKTDLIINRFLYFFCLSFNFSKLDKSTTIPSLAKTDLQKIDVILPSIDEQQLIVSELESKLTVCDKMEETINESLQQAETLRQSILKRAFEGRLVNYEIENVNYIDG